MNFKKKLKKVDLIETSLTLRTKYLEKEIKSFYNLNLIISILTILTSIITAISFLSTIISTADFSANIWYTVLAILTIVLSIISFIYTLKTMRPAKFINKMIEDQYDVEEFTAIFIIRAPLKIHSCP